MSEIVWQDPPEPKRKVGKAREFVEALRDRPGCWALYPTTMTNGSPSQYRATFPDVEWTARRRDDGKFDLYARWIGGES